MVPWLKPTSASADGGKQPGKLGIDEAFQHRRRLVDADPAFIGIAEGEGEPLPPDRRLPARLGRMRRDERRLRQQLLPHPANLDEVVAVGAVAVQKHDQLARRSRQRRKPRTIKLSGHSPSCRLAWHHPLRARGHERASQAAQTAVERLIWLFSPAFGRTAPVGWTCMHAIEGLMLALVVAAAVVPNQP